MLVFSIKWMVMRKNERFYLLIQCKTWSKRKLSWICMKESCYCARIHNSLLLNSSKLFHPSLSSPPTSFSVSSFRIRNKFLNPHLLLTVYYSATSLLFFGCSCFGLGIFLSENLTRQNDKLSSSSRISFKRKNQLSLINLYTLLKKKFYFSH